MYDYQRVHRDKSRGDDLLATTHVAYYMAHTPPRGPKPPTPSHNPTCLTPNSFLPLRYGDVPYHDEAGRPQTMRTDKTNNEPNKTRRCTQSTKHRDDYDCHVPAHYTDKRGGEETDED